MKKQFEMTREIFNRCSGNQMRDVFFEEIEADDEKLDGLVEQYLKGKDVLCEKYESPGVTVFEITVDGLKQKITFCEA